MRKIILVACAALAMLCVLASCSSDGGSSDKPSSASTATVSLGCQLQKTVEKGGTIEIPDLICNNGRTATQVIWNGRPGDNTTWKVATNSTLDSYTISVTATCGSVYIEDQPCGTVKVKTASSSSGGAGSSSSAGGGSSSSVNGESSSSVAPLTCTLQSTTVVRGSTIPTPTLTCGNGETATSPNWNGRPQTNTTWEVDANGSTNSYTITVSAICGTDTERIPAVSCGTVNVVDAGSSSSVGGGSSSSTGGDSSSSVGGGSSSSTGGGSSSSVGGESSSSTGGDSSSSSVATSDNQTFTDVRDQQTYKFVTIGEQTWMAENLNFNAEGSKCYNNEEANCNTYGRLYTWASREDVCPAGWHLPSDAEWNTLGENVGGLSTAGNKLKAISNLWYAGASGQFAGANTDDYGFSALPGGYYETAVGASGFANLGRDGSWWTIEINSGNSVFHWFLGYNTSGFSRTANWNTILRSVRCVKD